MEEQIRKVKRCFGTYGNKDLERTVIDPDTGKEKKVLDCTMMCNDFALCKDCYFTWYLEYKNKKVKLSEFILKFMKKFKLEFKKNRYLFRKS